MLKSLISGIAFVLFVCDVAAATETVTSEPGKDRPGSDYQRLDLRQGNAEDCRDACKRDQRCRAYTYVKPGVQGPNAYCYLKNAVPEARTNACCTSGVKTRATVRSLPKSGGARAPVQPSPPPEPKGDEGVTLPPGVAPVVGIVPAAYIQLQLGAGDTVRYQNSIDITRTERLSFRVTANKDIDAKWELHWIQTRSTQRLSSGDLGRLNKGQFRVFSTNVPAGTPPNGAILRMMVLARPAGSTDRYKATGNYVTINYNKPSAPKPIAEAFLPADEYLAIRQLELMNALNPQFEIMEVLTEDCGGETLYLSGKMYTSQIPTAQYQPDYISVFKGKTKRIYLYNQLSNWNAAYNDGVGRFLWHCGTDTGPGVGYSHRWSECTEGVNSATQLDAVTFSRPASGDELTIRCEVLSDMNRPEYYPTSIVEYSCGGAAAYASSPDGGQETGAVYRGERSKWIRLGTKRRVNVGCGDLTSTGQSLSPHTCGSAAQAFPHIAQIVRFEGRDTFYLLCGAGEMSNGRRPEPSNWQDYWYDIWGGDILAKP